MNKITLYQAINMVILVLTSALLILGPLSIWSLLFIFSFCLSAWELFKTEITSIYNKAKSYLSDLTGN